MSIESHFFIEQGAFLANTSLQSFGPQNANEFNLTTSFSLSGEKKAYSICKGIVLIQPQTGSTTKVNLILRPFTQPFPGLSIKYFIYRGLKKSDFVVDGVSEKEIATTGTSDFVTKIRADFTAYYQSLAIAEPHFLAKFIGYNETLNDTEIPISDFFFKESLMVEATPGVYTEEENKDFELPMIDGGKSLGNFIGVDCGIDVVLNYGDYQHEFDNGEFKLNLAYARAQFSKITLMGTDIQKKIQREQSNQFIDIVAFYGMFINDGGRVKCYDNGGVSYTKTGVAIYNDLLGSFDTKNRWYLYIQSDRSRSYDFYKNYALSTTNINNLKLGNSSTLLTEAVYGTNDWPMLILDVPLIANTNNICKKFLQLVTDNNFNTALYAQTGVIEKTQNGFCDADFLRQPPDTNGVYGNLTNVIELHQNSLPNGTVIAGITQLLYQGILYKYKSGTTVDEDNVTVDLMAIPNFFDDIFGLIYSKPLLQLNASTDFSKMTEIRTQLINHYFDQKQQGISVVQTLTVNDIIETGDEGIPSVARVTYITEPQNVMTNITSSTDKLTNDSKNTISVSGAVTKSKTYMLPEPYYYILQPFSDGAQTINGIQLKTLDGSIPAKIILGLTKEENLSLKTIIIDENTSPKTFLNPKLFLLDLFEDGNELTSPENIKFQKYKVGMVGEQADGSLRLFYPAADVIVYSLDRLYHFSKGYSEYVLEIDFQSEYLTVNTDIE